MKTTFKNIIVDNDPCQHTRFLSVCPRGKWGINCEKTCTCGTFIACRKDTGGCIGNCFPGTSYIPSINLCSGNNEVLLPLKTILKHLYIFFVKSVYNYNYIGCNGYPFNIGIVQN